MKAILKTARGKVVLVTTGQPSINPRLVKEADTLADAGFEVTVLYAYWNEWATNADEELFKKKKWQAIRVAGDPKKKALSFFLSKVIHRLSTIIAKLTGSRYLSEFAIARSSFFLCHEVNKHKADLYIGHNMGALAAVLKAAKYHKKPCGFDAEDFHRNEISDDALAFQVILRKYLEDKYIPRVNYLTTSSPLISQAYQKLYLNSPVTLLNVFPIDHRPAELNAADSSPIRLFWFSQTISVERGVMDCINALKIINAGEIELHLLGWADDDTKQQLADHTGNSFKLFIHAPIPPCAIIPFAARFDIGLATEHSSPYNRDICLTNKIFTYVQSGLAVLASDTTAQSELLKRHPNIGVLYEKNNACAMANIIRDLMDNREKLKKLKHEAFQAGYKELNWEVEGKKFLSIIREMLPS